MNGPYPTVVWVRTTNNGQRYRVVQVAPTGTPRAYRLESAKLDAMGVESWRTIVGSDHAWSLLARSYRELRDLMERYL